MEESQDWWSGAGHGGLCVHGAGTARRSLFTPMTWCGNQDSGACIALAATDTAFRPQTGEIHRFIPPKRRDTPLSAPKAAGYTGIFCPLTWKSAEQSVPGVPAG
jgi:hypothetical protein